MKKAIIYLLLLCALLAAGAGVYLWNKPHRNIEDARPMPVNAAELSAAFEADEAGANRTYLNQPLTVSGIVGEVADNASGQMVVFIRGYDDLSGVQCTLRKGAANGKPAVGDQVTISGFCNGYTTVVILDDCKFVR